MRERRRNDGSSVAERQSTYIGRVRGVPQRIAAFGAGGTRAAREAAFARFVDRGFPTTRDEEWRFTSVAPIAATPFEPRRQRSIRADALEPFLFAGWPHRVVVVNGRFSRELSDARVAAGGRDASARRRGRRRMRPSRSVARAFVDLNTAFFQAALTIDHRAEGRRRRAAAPAVHRERSAVPALVSPRVLVTVGERRAGVDRRALRRHRRRRDVHERGDRLRTRRQAPSSIT